MKQRPDETLHEWWERIWKEMWSANTDAPEVPPVPHSAIKITTGGSQVDDPAGGGGAALRPCGEGERRCRIGF